MHASILRLGSGLSTNEILAPHRTVHPELVEGWCVLLLSLFQIGFLYMRNTLSFG